MPTTCGFPNCKFRSRYRGFEDNRHFYRVPKKPAYLREKWLEAIGRTEANIVSQLRICSGHFHGGEKHEGDIPVRDPAIDSPLRIELPPKGTRLSSTESTRALSFYNNSHIHRHYHHHPTPRGAQRRGVPLNVLRQPMSPFTLPVIAPTSEPLDNVWMSVFQAWGSLLGVTNPRSFIQQLPIFPGLALPAPQQQLMQSNPGDCISKRIVIFGEPPSGMGQSDTMKNIRTPIEDSITIRKLSEAYQNVKAFQTTSVAVFYDTGLVNKEILRHFTQLQCVILADIYCSETDLVSLYFKEKGILVKLVKIDYDVNAAADAVFRKILSSNYEKPSLTLDPDCGVSPTLGNRMLGIVGLDSIALAVARRCSAFGIRVIVFDPSLPDGVAAGLGLKRYEHLEDLLACSDFLSFHHPHSKAALQTSPQHTITSNHLGQLKNGVFIICLMDNIAFDGTALLRVLGQRVIKNIALTTDNVAKVLPGVSPRLHGVLVISKSELLTKESLHMHRRRVDYEAAHLLRNVTTTENTQFQLDASQETTTHSSGWLKPECPCGTYELKTDEDPKAVKRDAFSVEALVTSQST